MTSWTVGQSVIIVVPRNRDPDIYDGQITKIGRKWITVRHPYAENRFDHQGWGDQDVGYKPRMWPDRATYAAHIERRHRWSEFHSLVRQQNHPPEHLTIEEIEEMIVRVRNDRQA